MKIILIYLICVICVPAFATNNASIIEQRRLEAHSDNDAIDNTRMQDENEQTINNIYLKILRDGGVALNNEDKDIIVELANECPYIGGTAVYKARTLNAMYSPASMFDDIKLCNNVGVYKTNNTSGNTKGIFDAENSYLKSLLPNSKIPILSTNKFNIYPNPASTQITIAYEMKYNEAGLVIIYDIVGRERMKIDLKASVNKIILNVTNLERGIYTYKYISNNFQKETGKFLIE